jgi:hypothetical protein
MKQAVSLNRFRLNPLRVSGGFFQWQHFSMATPGGY